MNFQMFKLHLEKPEPPEIKLPTSAGSLKKEEEIKHCYCFKTLSFGVLFLFLFLQEEKINTSSNKIFSRVCCDLHKRFSVVNEAEVDAFLEFSRFFYDLRDVGNLTSGSSAFSKYIWKFLVHILLKPSF